MNIIIAAIVVIHIIIILYSQLKNVQYVCVWLVKSFISSVVAVQLLVNRLKLDRLQM